MVAASVKYSVVIYTDYFDSFVSYNKYLYCYTEIIWHFQLPKMKLGTSEVNTAKWADTTKYQGTGHN